MTEEKYLKLRDTVVDKLTRFKKDHHGNMSALARELEMTPQYISRIRSEVISRPSAEELIKIKDKLKFI